MAESPYVTCFSDLYCKEFEWAMKKCSLFFHLPISTYFWRMTSANLVPELIAQSGHARRRVARFPFGRSAELKRAKSKLDMHVSECV